MNKRRQQVQFVVENALKESSILSAFGSGFGGQDAISHAQEAGSLLKTYQELRRKDPRHPVLPKLRSAYKKQMAKSRATLKHPIARGVGVVSGKLYDPVKDRIVAAAGRGLDMALDIKTVYGMGGDQPVVGEYSGPQSQRL